MNFIDLYGNKLKKLNCIGCNKDISGVAHHKKGYCLGCAFSKGLIK